MILKIDFSSFQCQLSLYDGKSLNVFVSKWEYYCKCSLVFYLVGYASFAGPMDHWTKFTQTSPEVYRHGWVIKSGKLSAGVRETGNDSLSQRLRESERWTGSKGNPSVNTHSSSVQRFIKIICLVITCSTCQWASLKKLRKIKQCIEKKGNHISLENLIHNRMEWTNPLSRWI